MNDYGYEGWKRYTVNKRVFTTRKELSQIPTNRIVKRGQKKELAANREE